MNFSYCLDCSTVWYLDISIWKHEIADTLHLHQSDRLDIPSCVFSPSINLPAGHRDSSRTPLSFSPLLLGYQLCSTANSLLAFGLINALDQSGHLTYNNDVEILPRGCRVKESACQAGDMSSIPGLRRSPGGGNGSPLQCSCLENPTDRGAWWATVHGVTKSWIQLST